jgi:hypothetical protein
MILDQQFSPGDVVFSHWRFEGRRTGMVGVVDRAGEGEERNLVWVWYGDYLRAYGLSDPNFDPYPKVEDRRTLSHWRGKRP